MADILSGAFGAAHHAIAVVGAGPRGTSVLERLCASVSELAPASRLSVHMIDPFPPGAGRVWRTDQSGELLMNTVASQVTLFTDASVRCEGPVRPGPSLYKWAVGRIPGLGPDDYPPRALYGAYLEWVFTQVVAEAPEKVTVEVHPTRAVRLSDDVPDGHGNVLQLLELENGRVLRSLSAVILAQGHLDVRPGAEEERHARYASGHGLRYLPPANPADVTAESARIAPGEPVLLRGLGLNFFDHIALLTSGRGGRFGREDDRLVYHASGHEPRLYAGSRRGIPYHARGDNEKGPYGRHEPLVLTPDVIAGFRKRVNSGDLPDFHTEVWPLVAKEVETVYYAALLNRVAPDSDPARDADSDADRGSARVQRFCESFLPTSHGSAEERAVLDRFGLAASGLRWEWERIARPHTGCSFTSRADFRDWLLSLLRRDAEQARLGNVSGPVKAALDVLRDLRNEVRQIVDHGGLPAASRRDHLDHWYTPLNAFLSIGPPRRRIEELTALIEAGVVEVLGPGLDVRQGVDEAGRPAFLADSPEVPGAPVTVRTLIEARLPEPDLRRTTDPLLTGLLRTGECRPHRLGSYETGGLDITRRPYRLVDRQGRPHPRRFAFGVPTEGVHWVTAAGARPGVDSVTLSDADAVARAALHHCMQPHLRTA